MELREYLDTINKHKWKVLICLILTVGLTVIYAVFTKPQFSFSACSKVEVATGDYYKTPEAVDVLTDLKLEYGDRDVSSQIEVMKTSTVTAETLDRLGLKLDDVQLMPLKALEGSNVIEVCAVSPQEKSAIDFVNTLPLSYFDFRTEMDKESARRSLERVDLAVEKQAKELENARNALSKFENENRAVNLERQIGEKLRLKENMEDDIKRRESSLEGLESKIRDLEEQKSQMDQEFTQKVRKENPEIDRLKSKKLELEQELTRLQSIYTDENPHVVQQQERIQKLEQALAAEEPYIFEEITYPKLEYQSVHKDLNAAMADKQEQITEIESLKKKLAKMIEDLRDLPKLQEQISNLEHDVQTEKFLYDELLTARQDQALRLTQLRPIGNIIEMADSAAPRGGRSLPLMVIVSCIIGLTLGVILAFVLEYLDDVIYTVEDVERHLNLRVLAQIAKDPEIEDNQLVCYLKPNAPVAEGFRSLRNRLRYLLAEKNIKSLLITSSVVDEGKSVCSVNLATTLAQFGSRVLLIDGDLRRPSLHKFFQVENKGLTNHIIDGEDIEDMILETEVLNLSFLPSGPLPLLESSPLNSSEFFESQTVKDLMKMLYVLYDYVIIDTPPVLAVSDSLSVAHIVDAILFVVDSGYVRQRDSIEAKRELELTKAHLLGVILNKVSFQKRGYYKYLYYYYGDEKRRNPLEDDSNGSGERPARKKIVQRP